MKRSGFSMIELVFVIVILGVLAAVAVPRFVATRTDAQIATARSDMASAMKAIVAKVFADNLDPQATTPPPPNEKADSPNRMKNWGEWIIEVAGLDGARWAASGKAINVGPYKPKNVDSVQPLGNVKKTAQGGGTSNYKGGCGTMLGIETGTGYMVFAPNNLDDLGAFCEGLKGSYKNSLGAGNRLVPLGSSETLQF